MQKLIIVRGIPGSGKSTFAERMFPNFKNFENDMFHIVNGKYQFDFSRQKAAIEWCRSQTEAALARGESVVVSNTFTRTDFITPYEELAEKYNCGFEVYSLAGGFKNVHNVPEQVIRSMRAGFQEYPGEIKVSIVNGEYVFN